jgi:DNA (cytosine-5)-methyltransferase 1
MRYLSVCSGVEAASVAWHDLGWTPVGFSEIEPFPSAVLAHRFPSVKNYGDMTKYKEWDLEPGTVDVLVGGTPCQSFSVAGLRKGLDDPRGNLMLVYLGLAEHLRVPWLVWENVPGVLSSNRGRDFGTFLGALEQLGYRWSFRVLDAQYFGVPQRRRRVFVIAHLGDGPHPASVLFESESLRGDSAKGGKKRQGAPRGAGKGAESGGRVGVDIVGTLCSDTHPGAYSGQDAYTGRLVPQFFDEQASGSQYGTGSVASTCSTRDYKDATDLVVQPMTQLPIGLDEEQNAVVDGFGTLKARMLGGGFEGTVAVCTTGYRTHALTRSQKGATEDGTGRGTPIVPAVLPFDTTQITSPHNRSQPKAGDPCHPLAAGAHPPAVVTGTLSSRATAGGGLGTDFEVAGGLQPTPTMAVRRLLPVECERLQGFPDDHTNIPWRGKPAPDGPRYKAMGNSMAVPVMRWIGQRLDRVAKGDL